MASWTFFTNHAHVLHCVARDPAIRLRDLAPRVGVTERAAQRIVADLVEAGYLERSRDGRRNRYRVRADLPLRHPVEQPHMVGEILAILADGGDTPHTRTGGPVNSESTNTNDTEDLAPERAAS
jgi:DNA-binding transcriptional ArsR family regulator